ncbi:MAG: lipopolysaccharide assembly protein LapA domain-containing protein [Limnochordales bacterium]|nr:lipopolysaccharide assembly protein LapA domain-containing protein [Limnochordales bacterium]
MQLLLIIALLFALAVAVFAVQNAEPITVNLIRWQLETSLVVVVVGSAAAGALVAGVFGFIRQVRASWRIRQLQGQVHRLEQRLKALEPPATDEAQRAADDPQSSPPVA